MTEEPNETLRRIIVTFWGLVALVCFIIGCPANFIAFTYFAWYKRSKASGVVYIVMTFIDGLICGFGFFIGVTGVLNNNKVINLLKLFFVVLLRGK